MQCVGRMVQCFCVHLLEHLDGSRLQNGVPLATLDGVSPYPQDSLGSVWIPAKSSILQILKLGGDNRHVSPGVAEDAKAQEGEGARGDSPPRRSVESCTSVR